MHLTRQPTALTMKSLSKRKLFMAVTNDELELPLCPPSTAEEVAQLLGIKVQSVRNMGTPTGQRLAAAAQGKYKVRNYKVIGFWDDDKI